jgi:hypothetical protein
MITPKKAVDLQVGDVIPAGAAAGPLTVYAVLNIADHDDLMVDVEAGANADVWDMPVLADAVGARDARWMSNTPGRFYRLYFRRGAVVNTGAAGQVV